MKLAINEWAEEDRPREKMLRMGASQLSNAELLAILIGSGSTKESAVDLMKHIMKDCNNNLNTLGKKTVDELQQYDGMGPAKAVTVLAACELGKRRAREKAEERLRLHSGSSVYEFMQPKMQDLDREEGWAIYLNQDFRLIKDQLISRGGISETAVDVRVILKEALLCNATIVIFCHNHPSGNPTPSSHDDRLTTQMKKACDLMRIYLADHVIICDGAYYSYKEMNRL